MRPQEARKASHISGYSLIQTGFGLQLHTIESSGPLLLPWVTFKQSHTTSRKVAVLDRGETFRFTNAKGVAG